MRICNSSRCVFDIRTVYHEIFVCRFANGVNSPQIAIANEIPNQTAWMTEHTGEVAFQACEDCILAACGAVLTHISELGGLFDAVSFYISYAFINLYIDVRPFHVGAEQQDAYLRLLYATAHTK